MSGEEISQAKMALLRAGMAAGSVVDSLGMADADKLEAYLPSPESDLGGDYREIVRATIALRRLLPKEGT